MPADLFTDIGDKIYNISEQVLLDQEIGKTASTFVHETADVKVIVNANGKVVTVILK